MNTHPPSSVLIICALMPEASPLIDALDLKPASSLGQIRRFGLDTPTPLFVSGIGPIASASAVGAARAHTSDCTRPSFLNVGICGHASFEKGTAWLAHQVFDAQRQHALYPAFTHRPVVRTDTLQTCHQVETSFTHPGGYDMEGHGFLQAALGFASAEQCALLKVVSDGPQDHATPTPLRLKAAQVRALIGAALEPIQQQLTQLAQVSAHLHARTADPPLFQELCQRARLSESQRHRLKRLLTQRAAQDEPVPLEVTTFVAHPQESLDTLEQALQAYAPLTPHPCVAR